MKKNKLLLKGILVAIISLPGILSPVRQAFAQCFNAPYNQFPGPFTPPACNGTAYTIATNCYAGEYSLVAVTSGNTYTFSSSNTTDYTTISNESGTTAYVFGVGPQVYTATFSGNVRFYTHTNAACGVEGVDRSRLVACQPPPVTVFYNNGSTVFVGSSTIVQANGNLVNRPSSFTNTNGSFTNNGNLTVTGNITSDDGFPDVGTGTLNLTGTVAQTISGSRIFRVYNLTMNNPAGVLLNNALQIEGAATFTNGVVDATNSGNLVIFNTNGSVSGTPTNASHVNGYVRKQGIGAFTYPLGNATNYQPVGVNLTANPGGLTALYVPADAGNAPYGTGGTETTPLVQYNTNEYWNLTPVTTATGTVTVYYDSYRPSYISSTSDLRVAHKVGGMWLSEGKASGVSGTTAAGSITSNAVSNWSPFTFGAVSAVILPLQWLSVSAVVKEDTKAAINWQVQEEKVKNYALERSTDGRNFTTIATLASQGNGTHTYGYTDATAFSSSRLAFYRILQQDADGNTSYSKTVQVAISKGTSISIYPMPFHTSFVVNSSVAQVATLTDNAGKTITKLLLKSGINTIQGQGWPTGTYYLTTGSGETYKLLKN